MGFGVDVQHGSGLVDQWLVDQGSIPDLTNRTDHSPRGTTSRLCAAFSRSRLIALLTIFFLGLFLWNSNLHDVWRIMTLDQSVLAGVGVPRQLDGAGLPHHPLARAAAIAEAAGVLSDVFRQHDRLHALDRAPIRAGDVARPALLARRTNVRFAEALGTVLTERVLDLFSILGIFLFFCVLRWNAFPNDTRRRSRRRDRMHGRPGRAASLFLVGLYFFGGAVRRLHEYIGRILPKRFREPWMKFFDAFAKTLAITERPARLLHRHLRHGRRSGSASPRSTGSSSSPCTIRCRTTPPSSSAA